MTYIKLLGTYGTERDVVEQATLSTGKHVEDTERFIRKLLKLKHMKPFEIIQLHFEVRAPIFIDRQLCTYRTLTASIAQSARYGATELDFFMPDDLREFLDEIDSQLYEDIMGVCSVFYKEMQEKYGPNNARLREILRGILPQNQLVTRRFQVNMRNFLHIIEERACSKAQPEMRDLAESMIDLVRPLYPTILGEVRPETKKESLP